MTAINGRIIPIAHTICASAAFLVALATGYSLHFHKIVTNAHFTYPDEWFPSVSATIGDRYPERSLFQILIALTAFPRFLLLLGHLFLNKSIACFIVGLVRTVSCGGWVYITSTDDHDTHDIFMITYMALTLPWDIMITRFSNSHKRHALVGGSFFLTLIPLIYWYIQHQVKKIPGAYSIYAYFEWALIILDIAFDSLSISEFSSLEINLTSSNETIVRNVLPTDGQDTSLDETDEDINITQTKITQIRESGDDEIEIFLERTEEVSIISPQDITGPSYDSFIYLTTNIFNSFIYWTAITSLACSIWHFPLWYMGISGYEAAILSYIGPIILYFPLAPTVIRQYGYLVGGLIIVGAYLVGVPESRLLVTSAGTTIITATFVLNLLSIKDNALNQAFTLTWIIGLVASVILKMGFYSNNPLWPIMNESNGGYNKTGLILVTIFGLLAPYTNSSHFVKHAKNESKSNMVSRKSGCSSKILVGFGFGSLLFAIHQLLTDSSTIIYWAWEGFREDGKEGPLQWPWSAAVCAVMLFSALISLKFRERPLLPSLVLCFSTFVLGNKDIIEWNKFYFGGIPYVASIISLIPTYTSALGDFGSLWMTVLSGLVYNLFILAHVWVVAYAFVPYGWLLRERIHIVLAASTILIVIGALISKPATLKQSSGSLLSNKFKQRITFYFTLLIALLGVFTKMLRPDGIPQPYHPDSNIITAGIWTIHFGLDNDMWASEDRMINLLKDLEVDVFGLLETDTQRITMGNRDLTNKLGKELNMYTDFGPGPNKHTWGCALFSKFPILKSTHHLLPSPNGELAPAIHATLLTYDAIPVDVFVFHSGQEEDVEDRLLQSQELSRLMGETSNPTILLSYLVTDPGEGNYNTYVSEQSGMHDIDPSDDDRWCEYILFKKLKRVGYARVSRGTITDTELQIGKFQVLRNDELAVLGEEIYNNEVVDEVYNDDFKFPDMFLGEGERGHCYHVFDAPRYYFAS